MKTYSGGCLCRYITYKIDGDPIFPHLCSCQMCQKWSGALTVAWVEFPLKALVWDGPGGNPAFYHSSENTQRGFCPKCGGALCAIEKNYGNVAITIASLQDSTSIIPSEHHSYQEEAPPWWKVAIGH